MTDFLYRLWIAFDQLVNVLLNGQPFETISARAWRMQEAGDQGWARAVRVINRLYFWQANHCRGAFVRSRERGQLAAAGEK